MAVEAYYNAETVWMSDLDKYASKVITERWGLPNLGDLKTVDWATVEPIDILTAGYPCQPFSNAGQRKGLNDERHIWPYIKDIISALRPNRVILENVRGHLTLGFKEVLADLTELGYDAKWSIVRASDVGAPHRRERLFVLAQPANTNSQRSLIRESDPEWDKGESQFEPSGSSKASTNASSEGLQGSSWERLRYEQSGKTTCDTNDKYQPYDRSMQELGSRFASRRQMRLRKPPNPLDINGKLNAEFVEYMMGLPVGWVTDLDISRSQQLKLLGNGVVPQQAYYAIDKLERL
jgi:DNA (cytosine-5)-methyltransferase 1